MLVGNVCAEAGRENRKHRPEGSWDWRPIPGRASLLQSIWHKL